MPPPSFNQYSVSPICKDIEFTSPQTRLPFGLQGRILQGEHSLWKETFCLPCFNLNETPRNSASGGQPLAFCSKCFESGCFCSRLLYLYKLFIIIYFALSSQRFFARTHYLFNKQTNVKSKGKGNELFCSTPIHCRHGFVDWIFFRELLWGADWDHEGG